MRDMRCNYARNKVELCDTYIKDTYAYETIIEKRGREKVMPSSLPQ